MELNLPLPGSGLNSPWLNLMQLPMVQTVKPRVIKRSTQTRMLWGLAVGTWWMMDCSKRVLCAKMISMTEVAMSVTENWQFSLLMNSAVKPN